MPVKLFSEQNINEVLLLIDHLARNNLYAKQSDFSWVQKMLSGFLLRLSAREYNGLPSCLQNKCLHYNQCIYIFETDHQKKDLLLEDYDDWQLAKDTALQTIDNLQEQNSLLETTGFKIKRRSDEHDGVTKYNYYVILNSAYKIHDIIRVLPEEHIGFGVYGKVRLGLSFVSGELYALKIEIAKHETFTKKMLLHLKSERHVLAMQHQLFGVVNRVGLHRKPASLEKTPIEKAVTCMPYYPGKNSFTCLRENVAVGSLQKKLMLVQMAIEIAKIHHKEIAHLDIKPGNFQQDMSTDLSAMIRIRLLDFGNSSSNHAGSIPYSFTPLYAAPEVSGYFVFNKSMATSDIQERLTSHDVRSIDEDTTHGVDRPAGMFAATNQLVTMSADVYSFGNMLHHDYQVQASFIHWMLNHDPKLRPTMDEVVSLLTNHCVSDHTLNEHEAYLLVTMAINSRNRKYDMLVDSILAIDRIFNGMSLLQQSFLLLYESYIVNRLQIKNIGNNDIYLAFLKLKLDELNRRLHLQQGNPPLYSCWHLLCSSKARQTVLVYKQETTAIENNLARARQIISSLQSDDDNACILSLFRQNCTFVSEKYRRFMSGSYVASETLQPPCVSLLPLNQTNSQVSLLSSSPINNEEQGSHSRLTHRRSTGAFSPISPSMLSYDIGLTTVEPTSFAETVAGPLLVTACDKFIDISNTKIMGSLERIDKLEKLRSHIGTPLLRESL